MSFLFEVFGVVNCRGEASPSYPSAHSCGYLTQIIVWQDFQLQMLAATFFFYVGLELGIIEVILNLTTL